MVDTLLSHCCSGVASMEQMEQLLPRAAQDQLRNSCKSNEIFWRHRRSQGVQWVHLHPPGR